MDPLTPVSPVMTARTTIRARRRKDRDIGVDFWGNCPVCRTHEGTGECLPVPPTGRCGAVPRGDRRTAMATVTLVAIQAAYILMDQRACVDEAIMLLQRASDGGRRHCGVS